MIQLNNMMHQRELTMLEHLFNLNGIISLLRQTIRDMSHANCNLIPETLCSPRRSSFSAKAVKIIICSTLLLHGFSWFQGTKFDTWHVTRSHQIASCHWMKIQENRGLNKLSGVKFYIRTHVRLSHFQYTWFITRRRDTATVDKKTAVTSSNSTV